MFEIIESLRTLVKPDHLRVDNNVFRLHYKATCLVLITFSLLISCRQYLGDPIDCVQSDDIPRKLIDTYCWIHSTFTLPKALDKEVGVEVAHPGVDSYSDGEERTYHAYYQWVCFMLFFQAIFFYFPHYIWQGWESQKMRTLSLGLEKPVLDDEERIRRKNHLVNYIYKNMNHQTIYFFKLYICEIFNFLNVVAQIYLTDVFLGGEFTTYGTQVIKITEMPQGQRSDPMIRVFPRVTKCSFYKFGSSGDIQKHDALCVLSINIINEKIYIFLWFWFIGLAILSSMVVIYRLVLIASPAIRRIVLRSQYPYSSKEYVDIVSRKCGLGDWFIVYLLSKNLESLNFKLVLDDLARKLEVRINDNLENRV